MTGKVSGDEEDDAVSPKEEKPLDCRPLGVGLRQPSEGTLSVLLHVRRSSAEDDGPAQMRRIQLGHELSWQHFTCAWRGRFRNCLLRRVHSESGLFQGFPCSQRFRRCSKNAAEFCATEKKPADTTPRSSAS